MGTGLVELDKKTVCLTDYAEKLAKSVINSSDLAERKARGQFFTSKAIGIFMASCFDLKGDNIRILDPGAGIGMLSVAVCERLLNLECPIKITLDAYETDLKLVPMLKQMLQKCKEVLGESGHSFDYNIIREDFILTNPDHLSGGTLFKDKCSLDRYDHIISNPPYYKLNKDSIYSNFATDFVSAHPNIYSLFMALSLKMLKPDGQMVFITPRSFCSGLYFKKFRKWLISHGRINNIHVFDSRKDVFSNEKVLQENIITKLTPAKRCSSKAKTVISKSTNSLFDDIQELKIEYEDIFHKKNGDIFIKVPTSKLDVRVQHVINDWKYTLKDFGFKVSTGPVVSFRATKFLTDNVDNEKRVPLLWMHNIQEMGIEWPVYKKKKEIAIKAVDESSPLLVPTSNYVLIKRFSSKEQKRRVHAGVLEQKNFRFKKIGIENHLNYIYKYGDDLSKEEVFGIAGILNASIVDIFFRMLNGSTQVNAVDIENLPFPSIENIRKIGKAVIEKKPRIGLELDELVVKKLGIEKKILDELKGVAQNGKN